MAAVPPICDFGWKAVDFALEGVDGETHTLERVRGPKGTLVMFICNHCPYVKSVIGRIAQEAKALQDLGIGVIAINANDPEDYPEDSFDNMKEFAARHGLSFAYAVDRTQAVARAYDAVCTPDFFGFDKNLELQYRGRLDESKTTLVAGARRELHEAMVQIAETGQGPAEQISSMGCSIKWRAA
jgi:peroxiredoxin